MSHWIAVALGGGLGAVVRYALSGWVVKKLPMGTFAVNVLGCLLIGVAIAVSVKLKWDNPVWRTFFVSGFLGALTTFSTFGYQTVELARDENLSLAAVNLFANLLVGLFAVVVGIWIGEGIAAYAIPE